MSELESGFYEKDFILRRLTFGDIKFLRDFFAAMPRSDSMTEVASHLKIRNPANLHHRLNRALEHFGVTAKIYEGNRLTHEGEALAAQVNELWKGPVAHLVHQRRSGRITVQLAMPEVITGRSFFELLRRLHDQAWGDKVELVAKRLPPSRLIYAAETGKGQYDLILTLAAVPSRRKQRDKSTRPRPTMTAVLRRVLLCLNDDPIVRQAWTGGTPAVAKDEWIRGRPLYLPPRHLLPGFCFERFDDLCDVHELNSFADAHAHTLAGRRAIAIAHPELIDEIEDKLCVSIPLGGSAGETLLGLYRSGNVGQKNDPHAEIVEQVSEVMELHLRELNQRSAKADRLNARLSLFRYMALTSDALADDPASIPDISGPPPKDWLWRHWHLAAFHVTPLGHLKGRHGPLDLNGQFKFAFELFGRIMQDQVDGRWQYHALWRSIDHQTHPGDREPRIEHTSVNFIFDETDLENQLLVGLWSGRPSGRGIVWAPGCGVVVLSTEEKRDDELDRIHRQFWGRLHHLIAPKANLGPSLGQGSV